MAKRESALSKIKYFEENFKIKLLEEYINTTHKHRWKCLNCNEEFVKSWNKIRDGNLCKCCKTIFKDKIDNLKTSQPEDLINKRRRILNEKYKDRIQHELTSILKIKLLDEEYINSHYFHNWECLECGEKFKHKLYKIKARFLCPGCYARGTPEYRLRKSEIRRSLFPERSTSHVTCEVCKIKFKTINSHHLKKHNMTTEQYKEMFPNSPITNDDLVNIKKTNDRESK